MNNEGKWKESRRRQKKRMLIMLNGLPEDNDQLHEKCEETID